MKKSAIIAGGSGSYKRNESDFYYTPKEATLALINFLRKEGLFYNMGGGDILAYEPACGNGAISEVLKDNGFIVDSADIRDTGYQDFIRDFLDDSILYSSEFSLNAYQAIITNPPFNLAEQFIKKSLDSEACVCMLLKAHFWHAKKRYEMFKQSNPTYVLPLTWRPAMSEDRGNSPTMDFQWTVWDRSLVAGTCKYIPLLKPVL